jgi:hypothetical protein
MQTVESLKNNYLAIESELFIFSDGPKTENTTQKVDAVRQYIHSITGFKTVTIYESDKNKGLANSIISGVTQIIRQYGKVIVLEDDLITARNFLDFMNQALDFYENNPIIHSISGYTLDLPSLHSYTKDYYLGYRASSWGWGTWINKWDSVDWEVKGYSKFKSNLFQQLKFIRGGSDMPRMLKNQMEGRIDSWAIRWCFHQFQNNMLSVFSTKSKLISIGFGKESTHTKKSNRFNTKLDEGTQTTFDFDENPEMNKLLVREFRIKFSIISRLKNIVVR